MLINEYNVNRNFKNKVKIITRKEINSNFKTIKSKLIEERQGFK